MRVRVRLCVDICGCVSRLSVFAYPGVCVCVCFLVLLCVSVGFSFCGRRQIHLLEVTNSGRVAEVLFVCAQSLHMLFHTTVHFFWFTGGSRVPSADLR